MTVLRPLPIRDTADAVLQFVFPPRCGGCATTVKSDFDPALPGGTQFCRVCHAALCPLIEYSCERCGARTGPYSQPVGECGHCRRRPLRFRSVICLGMYERLMRHVVLSAKWSWSTAMMQTLGRMLAAERSDRFLSLSPDVVIPIPHHWRQRLTRRFNPSSLIAEELGRSLRLPCDHLILRRRRRARPQKRVAVASRFENQSGTFGFINGHLIRGQRVLLVDDVLTTGATCSEAARVLLAAGASECHVAVIARVLDQAAG